MLVDNIFKLVNKFAAEEDQLSANFGFILKNDTKILDAFFKTIRVSASLKDMRHTDIETQVSYDSGKSRIDIQMTVPEKYLIFLESKIVATKIDTIFRQLKKYRKILESRRADYHAVRLVYVCRNPMSPKEIRLLRKRLKLREDEFFFFSWEDLLRLASRFKQKELAKLFAEYMGDSMYNKKYIREQKIKSMADVLVIFTNQHFWEMTKQKYIAVQKNGTLDAHYVAFLRTHRDGNKRSAITHIAEVEYTETNIPRKNMLIGLPLKVKKEHLEHMKKRGIDSSGTHKHYVLKKGSLVQLAHEIPHFGNKGMLNFKTSLGELLRAHTTRDIRVLSKIK
ncbi:MAG: PD-(D/E)XK nuclease family protein [bacterium]|nr:PD-(D/E)XK nuclease family protein [bacterium]